MKLKVKYLIIVYFEKKHVFDEFETVWVHIIAYSLQGTTGNIYKRKIIYY